MQQTFQCYKCGAQNNKGQPYCWNCQSPFQYNCPSCRAIVNSSFSVCPNCGLSLNWPSRQPTVPIHNPQQQDDERKNMKEKIKEILGKIGLGALTVGVLGASGIIGILRIILVWGTGLSVVSLGIYLLFNGSILWGLIVLFIGTPVAVWFASFLFPFYIILLIIGLIIVLIRWIFHL